MTNHQLALYHMWHKHKFMNWIMHGLIQFPCMLCSASRVHVNKQTKSWGMRVQCGNITSTEMGLFMRTPSCKLSNPVVTMQLYIATHQNASLQLTQTYFNFTQLSSMYLYVLTCINEETLMKVANFMRYILTYV